MVSKPENGGGYWTCRVCSFADNTCSDSGVEKCTICNCPRNKKSALSMKGNSVKSVNGTTANSSRDETGKTPSRTDIPLQNFKMSPSKIDRADYYAARKVQPETVLVNFGDGDDDDDLDRKMPARRIDRTPTDEDDDLDRKPSARRLDRTSREKDDDLDRKPPAVQEQIKSCTAGEGLTEVPAPESCPPLGGSRRQSVGGSRRESLTLSELMHGLSEESLNEECENKNGDNYHESPVVSAKAMQMSFANWSTSDNGPWKCPSCTYVNPNPLHLTCGVCGVARNKKCDGKQGNTPKLDFELSISSEQALLVVMENQVSSDGDMDELVRRQVEEVARIRLSNKQSPSAAIPGEGEKDHKRAPQSSSSTKSSKLDRELMKKNLAESIARAEAMEKVHWNEKANEDPDTWSARHAQLQEIRQKQQALLAAMM